MTSLGLSNILRDRRNCFLGGYTLALFRRTCPLIGEPFIRLILLPNDSCRVFTDPINWLLPDLLSRGGDSVKHSSSDGIEGRASDDVQVFIAPNLNAGNCSCVGLLRGIVFVEKPLSLVSEGRRKVGFLRLFKRLEFSFWLITALYLTRSPGSKL